MLDGQTYYKVCTSACRTSACASRRAESHALTVDVSDRIRSETETPRRCRSSARNTNAGQRALLMNAATATDARPRIANNLGDHNRNFVRGRNTTAPLRTNGGQRALWRDCAQLRNAIRMAIPNHDDPTATLDDADLVGDIERIVVRSQAHVRLLQAVRPADTQHAILYGEQAARPMAVVAGNSGSS